MGIYRLTAKVEPRIAEAFRLYKGGEKGTSKRGTFQGGDDYSSTYLRMVPNERFDNEPATDPRFETMSDQMLARWEEIISSGRVPVRFPYATIEQCFPWTNAIFAAGEKCVGRCDGVTQTRWPEKAPHPSKPSQTITIAKNGERACSAVEDGEDCPLGCKLRATLKIYVPGLYPGGLGVFPIGSIIDVTTLLAELEPYRDVDLRLIPFSLYRKRQVIEKANGQMGDNWGLHLEIDPQISQALKAANDRRFLKGLETDVIDAEFSDSRLMAALPPTKKIEGPEFSGHDRHAFIEAIGKAARAGDRPGIDAAVLAARELGEGGVYRLGSVDACIERELEIALDVCGQMSLAKSAPSAKPAKAKKKEKAIEYQAEAVAKALWNTLQAKGWTSPYLLAQLEEFNLTSLKAVPIDRWNTIQAALLEMPVPGVPQEADVVDPAIGEWDTTEPAIVEGEAVEDPAEMEFTYIPEEVPV